MLETLGNLGDFIGGIGVLVSLVYLAVQIRQNTVAMKSDSYQAVVAAVSDWSREVSSDPDLCRILLAGFADFKTLGPVERFQFSLAMSSFFRNMENVHAKFESGAIDATAWEGWANRTRGFLVSPGMKDWWQQNETAFSSGFRRFILEPHEGVGLPDSGFRPTHS